MQIKALQITRKVTLVRPDRACKTAPLRPPTTTTTTTSETTTMHTSAHPIARLSSGACTWVSEPGDKYLVTGINRNGRRFRISSTTWAHARCVNIFQGTRWLVRNGRRYRIQCVTN